MILGKHVIGHWSRTQANVALSSGEAELNAALKGGCESLHVRSIGRDWGKEYKLRLWGDSSASKGILQRRGFGKMKHLSVKQLWMQERVDTGEISVGKVPRDENVSDLCTHHWTRAEGANHMGRLSVEVRPA